MNRLLVLGGARSGKSRYAQQRIEAFEGKLVYIATAQALDQEMADRVAQHQADRGGRWRTVEAPIDLPDAIQQTGASCDAILVDCLTLWLSNLLVRSPGATDPPGPHAADLATRRLDALVEALRLRRAHVVLVSNEVGMGLVPETPLGRLFRDLAGGAHQRLAAIADEVYLAATGVVLRLRPAPVEVMGG